MATDTTFSTTLDTGLDTTLGFIGIGLMGNPMVLRLLSAGHSVVVYNRSAAKLDEVKKAGAKVAESAAAVAASADVIFLCLTDAAAVKQVVLGEQGIASGAAEGKLLVDFSSIAPRDTVQIANELRRETGVRWVDAPVSGGVNGAQQGKLVIMCGGDEADVERAGPFFKPLSQRVTHMGPLGSGQITKLCNQVIVSCNLAVIAEAINLAKNAGVNAERLPQALQGGFADSLPLQIFGPRMAVEQRREPLGEISTMLKDASNALQYAQSVSAPLPMTDAAIEIYKLVADKGYLHADLESLMQQFTSKNGG